MHLFFYTKFRPPKKSDYKSGTLFFMRNNDLLLCISFFIQNFAHQKKAIIKAVRFLICVTMICYYASLFLYKISPHLAIIKAVRFLICVNYLPSFNPFFVLPFLYITKSPSVLKSFRFFISQNRSMLCFLYSKPE